MNVIEKKLENSSKNTQYQYRMNGTIGYDFFDARIFVDINNNEGIITQIDTGNRIIKNIAHYTFKDISGKWTNFKTTNLKNSDQGEIEMIWNEQFFKYKLNGKVVDSKFSGSAYGTHIKSNNNGFCSFEIFLTKENY